MEDEKQELSNNEQQQDENQELKFTQQQFNEALRKEIERKTKGQPSNEELLEFKQWKESQKNNQNNNDGSKKEEKPSDEQSEEPKEDINEQNAIKEVKVLKSGVDKEFSEFVTYQVSKMEGDFSKNLTKFLKDNPKYLSNNDDTKFIRKVGSSLNLSGGKPNNQTINQKMNDLIRSARD